MRVTVLRSIDDETEVTVVTGPTPTNSALRTRLAVFCEALPAATETRTEV